MMRSNVTLAVWFAAFLQASVAFSATYYISPTGADSNPGTLDKPWRTFSYALDSSRAWCGDTLTLLNGTYGNDTKTGKLDINGVSCTAGNELTVRAQNQRKAKIVTDGHGKAIWIRNSSYIVVDGLYGRAADDPMSTNSGEGQPISVNTCHHVKVKNSVFRNPNRYGNTAAFGILYSQDVLSEDNEVYVFHRHCHSAGSSLRVTVRRAYCNPRGGGLSGSSVGNPNQGDSLFSMYPCTYCTLENSIADGTTNRMFLNENNATYDRGVLVRGNKVLGSICYKCNHGNGIYANARKRPGLNNTPQDLTIRDVAFVDYNSGGSMIRCSDCVNATIDHISGFGAGSAGSGIGADDTPNGAEPSQQSVTITNSLISNVTGYAFRIISPTTWSGDRLLANNAGIASFAPGLSARWTNTSTAAHGMGTCKLWVPDGAFGKGKGTGGSDIGATILYRYVDGVLTKTPLWNPQTGELPYGAEDLDGTNRVAGESLFDIHKRLNVNTNGCPFPKDYANGPPTPGKPHSFEVK